MYKDGVPVHKRFLKLEQDLDLFSIKIKNINIWKRIRIQIYKKILTSLNHIENPHDKGESILNNHAIKKYLTFLKKWAKSAIYKNPYITRKEDFLFYGHERRKQIDGEHWWDIYCDPITQKLGSNYVHIEKQYKYGHKKPAKSDNLKYLDFLYHTKLFQEKLSLKSISLSTNDMDNIKQMSDGFKKEFGVDIDFETQITKAIRNRMSNKWMYEKLIKKISPKVAVLVVSYGKEDFIEACKDNDVPVVELQHGIIHQTHMGYHFPHNVGVELFPDYLLTFGEYWCDCVDYPINDDRVIPVGYPYLEMESKKHNDVDKRDQIVFISQGTVGENISKFAVELSESNTEYDIVYKLHPGEYDRWPNEYPWLKDADLRIVDSDEPPLYRLFAESKVQIGVGSTAIYEGLNFNLNTYILDLPGKQSMDYLLKNGNANLVNTVDDLLSQMKIGARKDKINTEYFFKHHSVENIIRTINKIKGQKSNHAAV